MQKIYPMLGALLQLFFKAFFQGAKLMVTAPFIVYHARAHQQKIGFAKGLPLFLAWVWVGRIVIDLVYFGTVDWLFSIITFGALMMLCGAIAKPLREGWENKERELRRAGVINNHVASPGAPATPAHLAPNVTDEATDANAPFLIRPAPPLPLIVYAENESLLRGTRIEPAPVVAAEIINRLHPTDRGMLDLLIDCGGVPVPFDVETTHFNISGSTGSGKTQFYNSALRTIRKRRMPAVVADNGGGFLSRFYVDGDVILNPFDARSVNWSPFAEIENSYDVKMIVKSAIPDAPAGSDSAEWIGYAQDYLTDAINIMRRNGERSMRRLLHLVAQADREELARVFAGTPTELLTRKGNDTPFSNARMIIKTYLAAWYDLPDEGDFSVRAWVRNVDNSASFLFVPYRDGQRAHLQHLIACWLDLAVAEGLELTENTTRRLYYVYDEIDSLGKIGKMRDGVTKLRKYGGVVMAGIQSVAQLQSTYGKDEATVLLANMLNKLVLLTSDHTTAAYWESEIGEQEIARIEVSRTTTKSIENFGSKSEATSTRIERRPAVMASQIQALKQQTGYLKLNNLYDGMPWAAVAFPTIGMHAVADAYVSRQDDDEPQPAATDEVTA